MMMFLKSLIARVASESKGALFIETLVAVTIFALVGTTMLGGISTARIAGARLQKVSIAETIARNQLEDIMAQDYAIPPSTYALITIPPEFVGFNVANVNATISAFGFSPDFAEVTVTVSQNGEVVLELTTRRIKDGLQ